MSTEQILALLVQERDRLENAIQALGGGGKRRGRPPKKGPAIEVGGTRPKRHVSAASRRKMALAQKRRWAALKSKEAAK